MKQLLGDFLRTSTPDGGSQPSIGFPRYIFEKSQPLHVVVVGLVGISKYLNYG